ncbi:MAG: putative manganese transporter [Firmicutes bacterium]|nr:putative manganese transporter [Bacillota bacterium]
MVLMKEILRLIVFSAENSFIQVTGFVGAVLIIFGYIDFKVSGALVKKIEKSKKTQPIIGSFLGLTPGCGGAIFVMPLFPKGTVSFGTVVATLIATMGDSAFVLMSVMPVQYIWVSIFSFIVAVATGYLVDHYDLGAGLLEGIELRKANKQKKKEIARKPLMAQSEQGDDTPVHIGHAEGDEIDYILHHCIKGHQEPGTLGYRFTHGAYPLYWAVILIGFIFGIMDLFQVDLNAFSIPNLGTIVGIAGTLLSIIMMVMGKKFICDDTHEESELKLLSFKETIIHNAQDTAFVGMWVFFAYLAYELFILALGRGDHSIGNQIAAAFLSQQGLTAVILGVLVGIIPGCGPQIIFVTLYTKGLIPFAALLANAISQDGDALFPLIAIDKRSAVRATVLNTIPAILVGLLAYLIEVKFFK